MRSRWTASWRTCTRSPGRSYVRLDARAGASAGAGAGTVSAAAADSGGGLDGTGGDGGAARAQADSSGRGRDRRRGRDGHPGVRRRPAGLVSICCSIAARNRSTY